MGEVPIGLIGKTKAQVFKEICFLIKTVATFMMSKEFTSFLRVQLRLRTELCSLCTPNTLY